jgi:hypothetical protein
MKFNITSTTVTHAEIELTAKDVMDLLRYVRTEHLAQTVRQPIRSLQAKLVSDKDVSLQIFVEVPGGGDWSRMKLDIDATTPLRVIITQTRERKETADGNAPETKRKAPPRCDDEDDEQDDL